MSEGARRSAEGAEPVSTLPGAPFELPAGSIVGEYRIESVIGRGGMGTVYAAVQPLIEKKVAIKVLSRQFSASPDGVRRFIDEARAVNRIGHENIIDIFSFGQLPDGQHYFVMEYLHGATLGDRLKAGDLAPDDVAGVLFQICDALEAAHAHKIVHRDLKLGNIWIADGRPDRLSVRLLDFGIAKLQVVDDREITEAGALVGTPQYMSPEQCHGRDVDQRSDIYAMGVILYRIYTGRMPISGATYPEIIAKQLSELPQRASAIAPISPALNRVIMSCLDKDPALRPQTARELATALKAALSSTDAAVGAAGLPSDAPTVAASAAAVAVWPRLVFAGLAVAGILVAIGWLVFRAPVLPSADQRRSASGISSPPIAGAATETAAAPPATPLPARDVNEVPQPSSPDAVKSPLGAPGRAAQERSPAKAVRRRKTAESDAPARAEPPPPPAAPAPVDTPVVPKKDYGF